MDEWSEPTRSGKTMATTRWREMKTTARLAYIGPGGDMVGAIGSSGVRARLGRSADAHVDQGSEAGNGRTEVV